MHADKTTDDSLCPFCGEENLCKPKNVQSCWCFNTKIPSELITLLPNSKRNLSCICKNCVLKFTDDPALFSEKHLNNLTRFIK